MKKIMLLILVLGYSQIRLSAQSVKPVYVIVHGAWGGGWAFKKTDSVLLAHGNTVYRVTLTGQGERAHLSSPEINLQTHISDVVSTVLYEELQDIILVGHSYGGMVITGVADSIPRRIKKLVYLDAFVPNDGESAVTARKDGKQGPERNVVDGFSVPGWVSKNAQPPKDVPQSYKTFTQPVSYKNKLALKLPATYILTVDKGAKPEEDFFYFFANRAKQRGWKVLQMTADHNPQWSDVRGLVELLEQEK
ncbi:MAG: alpha/beta hydrolase [Niabella sp.]